MIDQEILDKAIEKAVKNGLAKEYFNRQLSNPTSLCLSPVSPSCSKFIDHPICSYNTYFSPESQNLLYIPLNYRLVIFDHNFAKAFWGEEKICKDGLTFKDYLTKRSQAGMTEQEARDDWEFDEECVTIPLWQYHLQQIVLSEEPLKYIEKYL